MSPIIPSTPSTPVPFPPTPTTWYILPQVEKRYTNLQDRYRKQSEELNWMSEVVDSHEEAVREEQTGPSHWEEQRRRWTKDFPPFDQSDIEEDPLTAKLRVASDRRLIQYYREIIEENRSFRKPTSLSSLIPILVAGWKDAGLWPNEESLRQEILDKGLNPGDFDLRLHVSAVLESNAGSDKDLDIKVARLLARQNKAADRKYAEMMLKS